MANVKQSQASASASQLVSSRFTGGNQNFSFTGRLSGGRTAPTLIRPVTINTPQVGPAQQVSLDLDTIPLSASKVPVALGVAAASLDVLGQAFQKAKDEKDRQDKFEEDLRVEMLTTRDGKDIDLLYLEGKRNPSVDTLSEFLAIANDSKREILEKNSETLSQEGYAKLEAKLNANRIKSIVGFQELTSIARANRVISSMNIEEQESMERIRLSDAPDESLSDAQGKMLAMVDAAESSGIITSSMAEKKRQKYEVLFPADVVEHIAGKDPDRAAKILEDNPAIPLSERTRLEKLIERSRGNANLRQADDAERALNQAADVAGRTGQIPAFLKEEMLKVVAATDPEKAETLRVELNASVVSGRVAREMEGRSIEEIEAIRDFYSIDPDVEAERVLSREEVLVHEKVQAAAAEQIELVKNEPYKASLEDPVIDQAFQLVHSLMDPNRKIPATSAEIFEAHQAATAASVQFQRVNLKKHESEIQVMTIKQAVLQAGNIREMDPKKAVEVLQGMEQKFGQFFPIAFKQMSQLPDGQKLPAGYQAITSVSDNRFKLETIIGAMRLDESNLGSGTEAVKGEIKEGVAAQKDLKALRHVIRRTNKDGQTEEFGDDIQNLTVRTALFLHQQKGLSVKQAVKQATAMVIGDEYVFAVTKRSTVAVRKALVSEQPLKSSDIRWLEMGLDKMLNPNITDVFTLSNTPMAQVHFETGEEFHEAKRQWLRTNAFWVNNADASGAILMINVPEAHNTQAWFGADGKPIEVKFIDVINKTRAMVHGSPFERLRPPPPPQ